MIISSLAIGIGLRRLGFNCGCVIFEELLAKPPKDQPGKYGQRPRADTHRRFRNNSAESYFGVGMPSRSDIRTSSARELAAIFSIT